MLVGLWSIRRVYGTSRVTLFPLLLECGQILLFTVVKYLLQRTVNKGKAIPLQAWTDLEGSRRVTITDFKTICT